MKKIISVVSIAGLLFGVVACSKEPPVQNNLSTEQTFLKVVRDEYPDLKLQTDDSLINLAKAACGALDKGLTKEGLIDMLSKNAPSAESLNELSFVVGAGIPAFCPQHIATVQG